jgi:hypothetical protein
MKLVRVLLGGAAIIVGCSSWAHDSLDPATMPEDIRPDYAVFAQRCSKCHSLARPLTSGIDDDDYWVDYVARMRRQPASGISQDDTIVILRFLHYFSLEEKRKKAKLPPGSPPAAAAVPPALPTAVPPALSAPPAPTQPATPAPESPHALQPVRTRGAL